VREYTLDRTTGFQWLNPVLAYLVPQRTTLYGFSLGLLVVALLWYGRTRTELRETLLAGILLGLVPLLHTATYFDLLLLAGGIAAVDLGFALFGKAGLDLATKRWLAFFAPALLLGLPQLLLILPPAAYGHSFLRWQVGWLASGPELSYRLSIGTFWLLNTALLIPLALGALLSGRWGKPGIRRFLAPAWLLFLLPNLVILQPWDWDNTKWFVWWAILASIMAGLAIHQLIRRRAAFMVVGLLLLLVTTASGALDLNRASQKNLPNVSFRLLDDQELIVADWAQANTPGDALFLTGWKNNHPILTLSRRAVVMGYPGWLWTWGLPGFVERQKDVIEMYKGDSRTAPLLRSYGVAYVVIGPQERQEIAANVAYYQSRYPIAYQSPTGEYVIFRVG
jgi:hypothetical protein